MHTAREALKFGRINGRDFYDYRHSAAPEIEDARIRLVWRNIAGARGDSERERFFEQCVQRHMDDSEIFRDYTLLDYETGGVIDFDPPEAVARAAHEETAEYIARLMLGASFAANDRPTLAFLFGKLYRAEAGLSAERLYPHALMYYCSAPLIAAAIADGRLQPVHLARYRDVAQDDDIVSRILREARRGDPLLRQALQAIDAAAGITWDAACACWPGVPQAHTSLRALAEARDLLPAALATAA